MRLIIKNKYSSNTFYSTREIYNTYLREAKEAKTIAVKKSIRYGRLK